MKLKFLCGFMISSHLNLCVDLMYLRVLRQAVFYRSITFSEKLKIILGFSGAIVTGLGILLRTSGMQYGSLLVVIGTLIIAFGFLPFLFFRMYRKSIEQI